MSRERAGYREALTDILAFSQGRRLLTIKDVRQYTGLVDSRSIKRRFPAFSDGYISATSFAYYLAGGGERRG